MKDIMKKLMKLAVLLFIFGGTVLHFSQNSAANVYAGTEEEEYADNYDLGEYVLDLSGVKKGEVLGEYIKNDYDKYIDYETLYNTMNILSHLGKIKSVSSDEGDYIFDVANDCVEINDKIRVKISGDSYDEYYAAWEYVAGFDYGIIDYSANSIDSDGDGYNDCYKFTLSASEAMNDPDFYTCNYFNTLIIKTGKCHVYFDANGGLSSLSRNYDLDIDVPVGSTFKELIMNNDNFFNIEKENYGLIYTYNNYYFDIDGFAYTYDAVIPETDIDLDYQFNKNTELYVVWKQTKCCVTIDANGGKFKNNKSVFSDYFYFGTKFEDILTGNGEVFSDASDDYGITRNKNDYEYKFLGFSTNKNATTPDTSINDAYKFNEPQTLYVVWEKTKCKVTIIVNEGALKNGSNSFSVYVPIGTKFEDIIKSNSDVLSDASDNYGLKDWVGTDYGHRFEGFAFSLGASVPDTAINSTYEFNESKTIYVVWKKYCVVTFNLGGKGENYTKWYEIGDKITKPTDPTAEGCEFAGWYAKKYSYDHSFEGYNPTSASVIKYDFDNTLNKNVIICAGWKVKYIKKGYDGGIIANPAYDDYFGTDSVYLNFSGEFKIEVDEPVYDTPDGKVFNGWYSDPNCTNLVIKPRPYNWIGPEDDSYSCLITITRDTTLYAGFVNKIEDVEFSAEIPKCGTKVTAKQAYIIPISSDAQTATPVVSVSADKNYTVVGAYWVDNSTFSLFKGVLNGNEPCKGVVIIKAKPGYGFTYGNIAGFNTVTKLSFNGEAWHNDLIFIPFTVNPEHDWDAGEITKKPTCKRMGVKTIKCKYCSDTKTEDIDMTEHKWGKGVVVREATSEKTGLKSYTCEICGDAKYEDIPKLTSAGLSKKESEAVDQLNKEIDYLPDADDVTLENAEKIKELVKEYDKMSEKQKEVIQGDKIKKLMQAYNKITILELEAADPDSEMNTDKAVNVLSDGGDLKNSTFADLQVKAKAKKNSITLSWKKVPDAKGYLVYGNLCGKKNKIIKIKATSDTKLALDKINGKAIEGGKYYKFIVVAYKDTQKFKHNIALSKSLHVATPGGKYTNVKKLTIKKTKVSIKKGKKYTIKAKFTKENKKLEAKRHTGLNGIRFESSNPSVAKVNSKGVVTAKKKGTATIYVYAQNGVCKKVKITVK